MFTQRMEEIGLVCPRMFTRRLEGFLEEIGRVCLIMLTQLMEGFPYPATIILPMVQVEECFKLIRIVHSTVIVHTVCRVLHLEVEVLMEDTSSPALL